MGQRVPDSQQIKFRGAAGSKVDASSSSDQQTASRFCRRAYLLVIAFKFGVGCLHASGIFNVAPPLTSGQAGGVEAGLTRAHQLAFHINNLLEVSHAARADVLSTAHRFDKAGVILGVQLFTAATTFALKSAGSALLTVIGPFGISAAIADNADSLHQIRMIHANQAVERAGGVAGVVIANHRGPGDRPRELAIQHAEDVLLMAAGR